MPNRDFRDLLCAFADARVEYLLVGAHALAVHGHVRGTGELDVPVIGKADLIANTRASGRLQDLADLEALGRVKLRRGGARRGR